MTPHELGRRDAPGGRASGSGVVAHSAPTVAAPGEAERSDEPFALLRAAVERREEPERAVRARD